MPAREHAGAAPAQRSEQATARAGQEAEATALEAARPGGPVSASAVLRLQRAAGNRAVSRAMVAQRDAVTSVAQREAAKKSLAEAIATEDEKAIEALKPFNRLTGGQLHSICNIVINKNLWVGPDNEDTIESAWRAYNPGPAALTDADWALWKKCEEHGAEVKLVPWLRELRSSFGSKAREVALGNLDANEGFIKAEAAKLGIRDSGAPQTTPSKEAEERLAGQRQAAREIKDAQQALKGLRSLKVGYELPSWGSDLPPGGTPEDVAKTEPPLATVTFTPGTPPPQGPKAGDPMPTYDQVLTIHQDITNAVSRIANENPAIYALIATGSSLDLMDRDDAAARTSIGDSFRAILENITKTRGEIQAGALGFQDLFPVHNRLYASDPVYSKPFAKALAQEHVADVGGDAAKAGMLLGFAAMALIVAVQIGSAGAATPLVAAIIGATAGAASAVDSWSQWDKLETAAKSTVNDETAVVAKEQVDSASLTALVDTAFALLDVFGVARALRAVTAAGRIAGRGAAKAAVSKLAQLADAAAPAARKKQVLSTGIEDYGVAEVVRRSGQSPEALLAIAGRDTPAGRRIAEYIAAGAGKEGAAESLAAALANFPKLARSEARVAALEAIDLLGPARALQRLGGWEALAKTVGHDAEAMTRLRPWRDRLCREATEFSNARKPVAGAAANTIADKEAARAFLGERSGLGGDAIEALLGVSIGLLGETLQEGLDRVQIGGEQLTIDLGSPVQRSAQRVAQRQPDKTATALAGLSGTEFELIVEPALKMGYFDEFLPKMQWVLPGHYNKKGWGIDRIGISKQGDRITIYHVELKYVSFGSPHPPSLGFSSAGGQTGRSWTENAVHQLLHADNEIAHASRERLKSALHQAYHPSARPSMEDFLRKKVTRAKVAIIAPAYANLSSIYRQVGGLVRSGRSVIVVRARVW